MWKRVTVGGADLRETWVAEQSGDVIRIVGQESFPPSPRGYVEAVHHNVTARLDNPIVPVTWGDKNLLDGYYRVTDGASVFDDQVNGGVVKADWGMSLERVGAGPDVLHESTVPMIGRVHGLGGGVTAQYWHAPPVGATGYVTGSGSPTSFVDRLSADGTIRAHLGIPIATPTWAVDAAEYLLGSVRIRDEDGWQRVGPATPGFWDGWQVDNGLVRITPGPFGRFDVACWDGGAWRSVTSWSVTVAGVVLTDTPELTIIRNDPEECIIRLGYPSASGRVTVDLGLRRGSRFVAGTLKRHSSAVLAIVEAFVAPGDGTYAAVTGGVRQAAADAEGNRWIVGGPQTSTAATGVGRTGVRLDFFVGHEVGAPTAPVAGDAFADLLRQYIGASSERVRVLHR